MSCLIDSLGDIGWGCELITKIVDDGDLRRILSKNGIETAKKYNWDHIEDKILVLYDPQRRAQTQKRKQAV